MSIRAKVIIVLAAYLAAIAALAASVLGVTLMEKATAAALETASLHARTAQEMLSRPHPPAPAELARAMPLSGFIEAWALVSADGTVVASGGARGEPPDRIDPHRASAEGFNMPPIPVSVPGKRYYYLARIPLGRFLPAGTATLFLGLVLAAGAMLAALYFLLERLVVEPVYELAEASRRIQEGEEPPPVPGEERSDEMGELVRTFNRLASEVAAFRREMNRLVEEATRKRLAAEASLVRAQRLNATARLAAGLAHEINNPLSGALNALDTLSSGSLSPEKRSEYIELLRDALSRIRSVIERMLAFQRGSSATGPLDLRGPLKEAVQLVSSKTRSVNIDIDLPDRPLFVEGRSPELVQVFLNLLLNAAEALDGSERPAISISLRAENGSAVAAISDNGPGIPHEILSRIPEPFLSEKPGGTGLGLVICHTIVENHGGRLEIESRPGEGTTARVVLPMKPSPEHH